MVAVVAFNGVSLDVDPYHIETIEGLLGPSNLRTSDLPRVARDGLVAGRDYREGRTVTITLSVSATTEAAYGAAVSALTAAFSAPRLTELPLTFTIPGVAGSLPARIYVRPRRLALPIPSLYFDWIGNAVVELFATDGLKYSDSAIVATIGLGVATGGFSFPLVFPLVFGGGGVAGIVTVTNAGNVASPPTIRINGPVTNPSIRNETVGRSITVGIVVASGDWLDIDVAARTVLLNGTASRYSSLTLAEWWNVEPGNNEIRFSGASAGSPTAVLTFRSAFS